jgi:hypothetical protein
VNHHIYLDDPVGIDSSKPTPQLGQLSTVGFSLPPARAALPNRARHRGHLVIRSAKKASEKSALNNSRKTTIANAQGKCPIAALAPTMKVAGMSNRN